LHGEALVAEGGESAGGAGELADEDPRAELRQAFRVAVHHRQPDCRLVTEGDGQRLLQMGAAGHRCRAVAPGEIRQDPAERLDVLLDEA
jgi:hypothetical protein